MKYKNLLLPFVILVCAAGVLLGAAKMLESVRIKNKEQSHNEIMALLLPGSASFEEEVYEGEDANITAVFKGATGYVVETAVGGYVDDIVLWVGVDSAGAVTGVTVRDMAETYGLGRNVMTDMNFLGQFIGMNGDAEIGMNVDAVAGATVSSKAVVKAINSAAAFVTGADVSAGATEWGG